MPTNILRRQRRTVVAGSSMPQQSGAKRVVLIQAGAVRLRAQLLATATADRVWEALPIYSTAELWGQSLHFETPVETGRDQTARATADRGDVCFWVEDDRIIIVFGPTPISRGGKIYLPMPCNVWAKAIDDVAPLKDIAAGEKVSVTAA